MKKKFIAALLAVLMIVAMGANSLFAAQGTNENEGDGSITITNAVENKVYDIYRIFDLTATDTNDDDVFDSYSYTVNPAWNNFFFGTDAPGAAFLVEKTDDNTETYKNCNELVKDGTVYFINITESNVADLANAALPYAVKLANSDGTKTATGSTLKFEDIALGYYLIYPQGATEITDGNASICSLTSTDPDAETVAKAVYPSITKEDDKEDVEIGELVTYTVTGTVPDTTGYVSYTYELNDKMTSGLTFNEEIADMTVEIDGTEITVPETGKVTLTYADNGFVMTFDMTKYQALKGKTITLTYKARVNEEAVCKVTENTVTLKYSNNPDGGTDKTPEISEQVCSSKIVVDKFEKGNTSKKLAHAKFVLVKKANDTESFYKYTAATTDTPASVTWYTLAEGETLASAIAAGKVTEVETDADGAAAFNGLKDGTYYLRETASPEGYNMLDDDVMCAVQHTPDTTTEKIIGISLTKQVANTTGTLLPTTGGIGTTVFYILGSLLVLGAIVLFVTKRRMAVKD